MLSDGHLGYEEIVGNYSHFINYLGDLTCPCVEPYTVVKDNFAVGVAGFVDGHAPHLLPGIETFTEEEHKAAIFALGKWLAEFHKASRNYAQEFPEEFEKINLWSEKKGGWQKDNLKPPPIPINSHTFGLIHGDFHQENVKLSKLPDQKNWKVTAFDWGDLQRSWYMIDLGTVIFQYQLQLLMTPSFRQLQSAESQQKVKWFINCLCEAYGESIDPKQLKACIDWRRDYLKLLFEKILLTRENEPQANQILKYILDLIEKRQFDLHFLAMEEVINEKKD